MSSFEKHKQVTQQVSVDCFVDVGSAILFIGHLPYYQKQRIAYLVVTIPQELVQKISESLESCVFSFGHLQCHRRWPTKK